MKTSDQASPPGGYVGGGLQMQTVFAISLSGDVWVMNNWQNIDGCFGVTERSSVDPPRWTGRDDLLRHGQTRAVRPASDSWAEGCAGEEDRPSPMNSLDVRPSMRTGRS